MSTRRTESLIRRIRRETGNESYGANSGISQTQICEYLNDGLHFIEEGLSSNHSQFFPKTDTIDLVANQEEYSLPSDMLLGAGVRLVEGLINTSDYRPLRKVSIFNRQGDASTSSNVQNEYIIEGNKILIRPFPTSALTDGLRIRYTKALNRLDVRRGTVDVATLNSGASTITTLSVDIATLLDPNEFDEHDYICIVDADGAFKMKNIPITGINTSTGNITVRSGFTYASGETIAVGDYVVFGKNTSTHQLDLDSNVERFLIAYAVYKVLKEDSSNDSVTQLDELTMMRESILESYATPNQDVLLVPIYE